MKELTYELSTPTFWRPGILPAVSPPPRQERTNGKAIAALVLGILSIVVPYIGLIFGIIAIVLAALAFKEIRLRYEQGRGLAIAGLVCGIVGTIIYAVLILLFVLALVMFGNIDTDTVNYFNNLNSF